MVGESEKDLSPKVIAIDIGTGTQDILLFRGEKHPEACFKMVLPSPTSLISARIKRATALGENVRLYGVNMGGGPSTHALKHHLSQDLQAFSTPSAAKTFNDDLSIVEKMGVILVSEEDLIQMPGSLVELKDLDLPTIETAFSLFGLTEDIPFITVAAQDHGEAPAGMSDRVFRFEHLKQRVMDGDFLEPYFPDNLPVFLTRLSAISETIGPRPHFLMDTGTAAITGILEDPYVSSHQNKLLVNIGNGHTLAALVDADNQVQGVFEHHTGMLDGDKLDDYLRNFSLGNLTNEQVFNEAGHGCYILKPFTELPFIAVTGPRRFIMEDSALKPYFAVPHGDTMLPGCYGLLRSWLNISE